MKNSACKKQLNSHWLSTLLAIVVALCILAAVFMVPEGLSYADSTAEILFPSNGYMQTSSPNLISANENYLLIFDDSLNRLFVRSSLSAEDYTYEIADKNVTQILAVGSTAFISADDLYYTIDLTDTSSVLTQVTIPTPTPSKKSPLTVASDGTYIYAKSVAGCISVYDENLETAFEADNIYQDILTGKCVFAGNADTVFTFTSSSGTPYFNTYKFGDAEYSEYEAEYYVQEAYAGDVIFASDNGEIIIVNKDDGTLIKETEIMPDSFCAFGSTLYTVVGDVISVYTYEAADNSLTLISSISMSGSDNRHLNLPLDVVKTFDMLIVADSNNNRAGFINSSGEMETVSLPASPFKLTVSQDAVYALCSDGNVYKISGGAVAQTYAVEGALDITFLDKLYALKNDGIYTLIGGRFVKFLSLSEGRLITSAKDGSSLYVLTDSEVKVVSRDAYLFSTSLTGSFENVSEFEADYAGNLYMLEESTVTKYTNSLYSLEASGTYEANSYLTISPNSFCIDGENIYISCDECLIIKDLFKTVTKDSYTEDELLPGDETLTYFEKSNANAFMTDAFGNPDSVTKVPGYAIGIYENVKKNTDLVLAKTKDGYFIVNINDFTQTESQQNINIYKTNKDADAYTDLLSSPTQIPAGTELTALYQQTIDGKTYIRTTYSDSEYFVEASSLELIQEIIIDDPEPQEPAKTYARIKSSRIGSKVSIYQNAAENSPVILQLVDGKKVQVLSEEDEFCRISYNGTEGYILKSSLQFKGLTTIQTIAIVLSVIVLAAGSVIAVSFYWQKKKNI
ncbi:MAG: SH3 domain-containing protein [Clostridia bacterium]|nr:SH3 domain-containing protein [Clostridia bacterium]